MVGGDVRPPAGAAVGIGPERPPRAQHRRDDVTPPLRTGLGRLDRHATCGRLVV
jgi:hypothetical protein